MTDINLSRRAVCSSHTLAVEASRHVPAGVFLSYGEEAGHLTPAEARQLRDELMKLLGEPEPASAEAPIRVGDRVVVVAEWRDDDGERETLSGRAGRVLSIGTGSYPYDVVLDGDEDAESVLCHSVRREDPAEEDPEPTDHIRVSAAQDAADFDRRRAAAATARELLGSRPDPEPVIRLASWLLGETD
ncbi:hypothetical protein ACFC26_07760 [Kitasatospora purpeofusca]|uniref:hypothetical protein n=1 Tax=Kitasatospora purpeofusca TaxID=67352 RepID=UPI0035E3895B